MHVKPSSNFIYHQVYLIKILCGTDIAFCFVWISEQTATSAIHNMNRMVFMLCLQRVEHAVDLEFLGVSQ